MSLKRPVKNQKHLIPEFERVLELLEGELDEFTCLFFSREGRDFYTSALGTNIFNNKDNIIDIPACFGIGSEKETRLFSRKDIELIFSTRIVALQLAICLLKDGFTTDDFK